MASACVHKLTDADVVAMREARAAGATHDELAELFGIHPKFAQRVCVGRVRAECGGPIEAQRVDPTPERCAGCGGMVFRPCLLCDLRAGRVVEDEQADDWPYQVKLIHTVRKRERGSP